MKAWANFVRKHVEPWRPEKAPQLRRHRKMQAVNDRWLDELKHRKEHPYGE